MADALFRLGISCTTVRAENRRTLSDESHVEFALANGLTIVTRDQDYVRMHNAGVVHAGIAYCPGLHRHPIGAFAQELARIAHEETQESMRGQLHYV